MILQKKLTSGLRDMFSRWKGKDFIDNFGISEIT